MARMTEIERKKKLEIARLLYLKRTPKPVIAENIDVKLETLNKWIKQHQWEKTRKREMMTPRKVQDMILHCASDMEEGSKPQHSPDALAKLANAYKNLSDKTKHEGYYLDAYTTLLEHITIHTAHEKNKQKKEYLKKLLEDVASFTQQVTKQHFSE